MKTFGKAIRSSLPAVGLGLISAFGLVAVTAVAAPAAVAQQPKIKAKKEFVENFEAARTALQSQQFQVALDKAAAAEPHAADNIQKSSLEQIKVPAYYSMKNWPAVIKSIETAMQLGIPEDLKKNYLGMLAGAYSESGNEAKAVELTTQYIDAYGGTPDQYAFLAKRKLDAKAFGEASSYAEKAVQQAQKDGKAVNPTHYNILLNAYAGANNLDQYYKTLEQVAPVLNKDVYWRPLIERAKKEPKFKSTEAMLDVYRTLEAAKVPLKPQEQQEMGEIALNAGNAIESERVLAPLFTSGALGGSGDPNADRNKKFYAKAQADAKADKAGGLAQSEKEAAAKPTGEVYIRTGESYLGAGDYAKAAELIQKGLDKGSLEPGTAELAKLRLGIAQMKAGQKEEARKTWSEVKGDNGSAWLAKVWTALSKV
jgi:tetratricopeptide (TPR) repeat protein